MNNFYRRTFDSNKMYNILKQVATIDTIVSYMISKLDHIRLGNHKTYKLINLIYH